MSTSTIYEIKSIPDSTFLGQDMLRVQESIHLAFERILEQFASIARSDEGYIRLIFLSEQGKSVGNVVGVYFHINGLNGQFVEQLFIGLKQIGYRIEVTDIAKQNNVLSKLKEISAGQTMAIVKSEKAINSPFSAMGYYYYTSIMERERDLPTDNFSAVLKLLETCPESMIAFDLIATQNLQEMYVMGEMKQSLEQLMQGMIYMGQMIQDASAQEVYPCYRHFAEAGGQAWFRYNIVISSANGFTSLLASQVLSALRFSTNNKTDFEILNVDDSVNVSQDIERFPIKLNEYLMYYYRNQIIWNSSIPPSNLFRLPFLVTAKEASIFFRLPVGDGTISAVKVSSVKPMGELIEKGVLNVDNIVFGELIDDDKVIGAPLTAFAKHGVIVGMPGTGKTTFSVNLLLQFYKRGIPFLAIEPTKTEYRAMIERIPELQIFTPGNNRVSPFIINPFIPPRGISVEQYIPSLFSAFQAAFSMPSPLDEAFKKAIQTSYIEYGWKDYSQYGDSDVTEFGLHEFIVVFKRLIKQMNYGKEVKGNLESGGVLRLSSLIEQNRNIYDTVHTIPIEDLLTKPTILELNAIDNIEQKALLMALLLINICLYTKNNFDGEGGLKNIILIDEAHVLLDEHKNSVQGMADSSGTTVKAIGNMIKEIRSKGTGIILADQTPSNIGKHIIANTDIKIAFRLVQSSEKELIADSTNMPEIDKNNLSKLHVGEAYVHYNLLEYPKLVMTEDIRKKENIRLSVTNQEVIDKMKYWSEHKELLKPFHECTFCDACKGGCDFKLRADAEYIAQKAFGIFRAAIKSSEDMVECVYRLGELMKEEIKQFGHVDERRLIACAQIRLYRAMKLEYSWRIPKKEFLKWIACSD